MASLHGSVGLGGRNWRPDVTVVQRLLTQAGASPGPVDGRCGRHTMQAIERFQTPFLRRPDGRVDVAGPTWRHLERVAATKGTPALHARPVHVATPSGHRASASHAAPSHARPSNAVARPLPVTPPPPAAPTPPSPTGGAHPATYWMERTPLSPQGTVNRGLTCPSSAQMENIFGDPHDHATTSRLKTSYVGPLHATGLVPALESLSAIFAKVRRDLPDLYPLVGSDGMTVVRNIRGRSCYSNHSWGTAIDLTINRFLVHLGDTQSCKGLDALVPYFNEAGWYWGGGYHHRKDCMHFECSLEMVRSFRL